MTYKTAQHPKTHLWHVVGNCGGGWWMQVSDGFKLRKDADAEINRKLRIDAAARKELQSL